MIENTLIKQLVLVGGGHANIQVLKKLSMFKVEGIQTILISENFEATYSGMTPGYIHKDFSKEEINIDLQKLCLNAGATFIRGRVIKFDVGDRKLELESLPSINYDLLSINSGSISNTKDINIENEAKCFSVKPISSFVKKLHKIDQIIKNNKCEISIIGGGVASFEIAFSLIRRYKNNIDITIFGNKILEEKNLNKKTKKKLRNISNNLGINYYSGEVVSISKTHLTLKNGEKIKSDLNLLSTGACIEDWLMDSDIDKDEKGFISVDENLLSTNNKNIFVTGDACSVLSINRPKSGVMAVRQGEVLKENIIFKLTNKPLIKFKPQKNWLYLIGTYQNKALLNYFFLSLHSEWCWSLKEWIDKRFINKFKFNTKSTMSKKILKIGHLKSNVMHCQGCGSKVSKKTLINYLKKNQKNIELSDSSIIDNKSLKILQSIDHIKLFTSFNPYDFGIISYLHSQNDILAAGGKVNSLSVSIAVPFSENFIEKFYLEYFMEGIKYQANKDKCVIASGHSYQSEEPGITLALNGEVHSLASKKLAEEGDLIYLSKALGTGYLLAAYLNNSQLISSNEFKNLIKYLKTGNYFTVDVAREFKSQTMTDISGFGLASHLIDICLSSNLSCELILNKKILINPNLELLKNFKSTGYENNLKSTKDFINISGSHPLKNILYDPQTNGPILLTIKLKYKEKFENIFSNKSYNKPILIGKFTKKFEKLININE